MLNERVDACRACGAALSPFMTFGRMPLANGFLTAERASSEYFFELAPGFCDRCGLFQLMEQPAADRMFHDGYPFYSSSSVRMQAHFEALASGIASRLAGQPDALVVEIGSNDGTLLRHVRRAGCRVLGVEPADNVARAARALGIETVGAFFDDGVAAAIVSQHGPAQVVVAANVICHIADIHSTAAGLARLLAPDGIVIIEEPYLGDMIAKTSYDQIYDEHVFMLSARSIGFVFARHGLELVDVLPQDTHGGSMRYVLAPAGSVAVQPAVERRREQERAHGLEEPRTYAAFKASCEASRSALRDLLSTLRRAGRRVAGYGATSKSATVTNYCGIGPDDIAFIADSTPLKQGTLSPGAHIPVVAPAEFARRAPDYAVLFAWNHAQEVFAKEPQFHAGGGRWITYVPTVTIAD
jgi:methylation protein EvaC